MNINHIEFLMGIDESFDELSKQNPKEPKISKLQDKFYNLANRQFIKSAYRGLHELSVEQVIKKQASEFYKIFPESIKKELIDTFIEMEHQRRRDNYFEFGFAIFKQVECYVNYLFEDGKLFQLIIDDRKIIIFGGKKIQEVVLKYYQYNEEGYDKEFANFCLTPLYVKNRDFQVKLRVIIAQSYFGKNNEGLYNFTNYTFQQKASPFYDIQQIRNLGHGGKISGILQKKANKQPLDYQEKIVIDSYENRYNNYLQYQGFLADFMNKVSKSQPQKIH